jgi:hypothetical protein
MPDLACPYVLVTPAGTVTFNDGSADQFYITDIPQGLAGAPISAPIDEAAFTDGSLSFNWWLRGRHITFEGNLYVTSAPLCSPAMVAVWNQMEETLRAALESTVPDETTAGTLTWTPSGQTQRVLTVRNDVPLECPPDQNYLVRTFHFGLFADDPAWAGS